MLLPDWDKDDEQRYDEEHAKKRAANRRTKPARKPKPHSVKAARQAHTGVIAVAVHLMRRRSGLFLSRQACALTPRMKTEV